MGNSKPQSDSAGSEKKTVLIVDDDDAVLNVLEIIVRNGGYKVLTAKSGDAAIESLPNKPDAILLDLVMPGKNSGLDVLRYLRESQGEIPHVIVVTGQVSDHPAVKEAKRDPNVSHFIGKPVNQEKLLMLLEHLLADSKIV